jgi:hypothetical protein
MFELMVLQSLIRKIGCRNVGPWQSSSIDVPLKYREGGRLRAQKEAVAVLERESMPLHRWGASILKDADGLRNTVLPFRRSALIPN